MDYGINPYYDQSFPKKKKFWIRHCGDIVLVGKILEEVKNRFKDWGEQHFKKND